MSLIGHYITDKELKEHRITEIVDDQPYDPSVGIMQGCTTVLTDTGTVFDVYDSGDVFQWIDPEDFDKGTIQLDSHDFWRHY